MKARLLFLSLLSFVLFSCATKPPAARPALDLKIVNGRIVDGTGAPWYRADIGVRGDTIVRIGDLSAVGAAKTIDARDRIVAPGFIDLLGQSERSVLDDPKVESKVRQGVTTEVSAEGWSPGPNSEVASRAGRTEERAGWPTLGDFFDELEEKGSAINFALFMGATNARSIVIGNVDRAATEDELARMEALVDEGMRDGAIGISTSLIYVPATFASTEELVRLARVASRHGGVYFTHIRTEGDAIISALDEAIRIGREASIPVNVWHLKTSGTSNHGRMAEVLAHIDAARRGGIDIAANMYPYTASGTGLTTLVPTWALEGGYAAFLQRMKDPAMRARIAEYVRVDSFPEHVGGADGVLVTRARGLEQYEKKTIQQIATELGADPVDALFQLFEASTTTPSGIFFKMNEDDVRTAIRHPFVAFGSDSGAVPEGRRTAGAHPRGYGTFPRVLGHYGRELALLSLEEGVRKMTSLAAARAKLGDRGLIRPGMKADIVVFDPDAIADRATFPDPHQYSVGIEHVIVNGSPVLESGAMTGNLPGRALRGPAYVPEVKR
ncbi:MAG TPA: D-aminoacylase [Thermoanaerobaculia bacterium]|nr:D-aminoacylase [Thermoanaerobaculia bacterium]